MGTTRTPQTKPGQGIMATNESDVMNITNVVRPMMQVVRSGRGGCPEGVPSVCELFLERAFITTKGSAVTRNGQQDSSYIAEWDSAWDDSPTGETM